MKWIFGYGSLIWRPGFVFEQRLMATLAGWRRAFTQQSPDHRGTPEKPGRVLTLRASGGAECQGIAFRISPDNWSKTIRYLDDRERGGYERVLVDLSLGSSIVSAVTYVAHPGNPHDAGNESYETIARIVKSAHGPSGSNQEYLTELHEALRVDGIVDEEISNLARTLKELS